jgi:hypothetical protein
MPIKYYEAPEIKQKVDQLAAECEFFHVVPQFVFCVRSKGSKSKRTIARIHGLGKLWQGVLNMPPAYTIEVISEIYDKMPAEDKEKPSSTSSCTSRAASEAASDLTKVTSSAKWSTQFTKNSKRSAPAQNHSTSSKTSTGNSGQSF